MNKHNKRLEHKIQNLNKYTFKWLEGKGGGGGETRND